MKPLFSLVVCGGIATPLAAAQIDLNVEIPRLTVAEYHKPYLAIWVENQDRSRIATLSVWYDVKMKNNEGTKWLKDMRQWWRRIGRELSMPADGISGATRAPGEHALSFGANSPLKQLPPGNYRLVVEAAREAGGREMLELPFQWPAKQSQQTKAQGSHELGGIVMNVKP